MKLQNIKAVLFDLDGTLVDSEYYYYSNWAPILKNEFGLEISYEDWIHDFAGHTLVNNVHLIREKYGLEVTEEFMWDSTRASYLKSDMRNINLMPYVKELLEYLKSQNVRIALVTSSYRTTVDTVLGNHGLLDYFEFFVTRDSVQNPKPNPEPYLLAVEKLGLDKSDVVAIEDTITGTTSAKSAGLKCIAVSKHEIERSRLVEKADILLEGLGELLN